MFPPKEATNNLVLRGDSQSEIFIIEQSTLASRTCETNDVTTNNSLLLLSRKAPSRDRPDDIIVPPLILEMGDKSRLSAGKASGRCRGFVSASLRSDRSSIRLTRGSNKVQTNTLDEKRVDGPLGTMSPDGHDVSLWAR